MININGRDYINDHNYHPLRSVLKKQPYRISDLDFILERDELGRPIRKIFGGMLELTYKDKNKKLFNQDAIVAIDKKMERLGNDEDALQNYFDKIDNAIEEEEEYKKNALERYAKYKSLDKTEKYKKEKHDVITAKKNIEGLKSLKDKYKNVEKAPTELILDKNNEEKKIESDVKDEYYKNQQKYKINQDGYGKAFEVVLRSYKSGKDVISKLTNSTSIINTYDNYSKLTTQKEKDNFPIGDLYNDKANIEVKYFNTKKFNVNVKNESIFENGIKQNYKGVPIQSTKFLGNTIYKGSETIPIFKYNEALDKTQLYQIKKSGVNIIPKSNLDYYILMMADDGLYYLDICESVDYFETFKGSNLFLINPLTSEILKYKKVYKLTDKNGNAYEKIIFYIPFKYWKKL